MVSVVGCAWRLCWLRVRVRRGSRFKPGGAACLRRSPLTAQAGRFRRSRGQHTAVSGRRLVTRRNDRAGDGETVRKVGLGLIHETASLEIDFETLHSRMEPITPRHPAGGIDNARERIDGRGAIHGMRATATIANGSATAAFWRSCIR